MKIIVDAFGGDNAPEEILKGGIKALNEKEGFSLIFVGDKDKMRPILENNKFDNNRVEIMDCKDVITNDDVPTTAIRTKTDSSLVVALKRLKEDDEVSGLVSAGSTGAVLTGATLKVGRIKGISRPALAPLLPTIKDGNVLLIDCGANVDCKPINLCHFAILGSEYMKNVFSVEKPRVALLSNGTEDKKGNELNHYVFKMLKQMPQINFVGNMEARDMLSGDYDVIVSDGFAGNIALKSAEGAIGAVLTFLKRGIMASFSAKIGSLFMKKTFKSLKNKLDYNKKGGAVFLGVSKVIIKSHGSSKDVAICNSIYQAIDMANSGYIEKIKLSLENLDLTEIEKSIEN